MKIIDGPALAEQLRHSHSKRVRMAVAFWGDGAVDNLGLKKISEVKIVCNLRLGGTNPREIKKIQQETHTEVRHSDTLHAKLFVLDDWGAIGSSNASANGLSFQGRECSGWTEANVIFGLGALYEAAEATFEQIWNTARPVQKSDLELAETAWTGRRFRLFAPGWKLTQSSLLEGLKSSAETLADRRIFLCLYRELMSDQAFAAIENERVRTGQGQELSGFEDWQALPDNADLVCFRVGPRGGIRFDGFWHMPRDRREKNFTDGNTVQFCEKLNSIAGINSAGSSAEWKGFIDQVWKDSEETAVVLEIGAFARRYLSSDSPPHKVV